METWLLQTFLTVAETGSISAAATRLGYAQSSVSEQVHRLERDLGVALLTRTSTGVSPTPAGRRLLGDAERVLAAVDALRHGTTTRQERLRVGAVDTLALRWLPPIVAALPAGDRPTITMDRRDRLLRALVEGRCDVVVLYRPVGAPLPSLAPALQAAAERLEVEVLDADELQVVGAPGRPADDDGWLVTQVGCVHREVFDRHVAPRLCDLRINAQAATPDALRQLARHGAGRALLPTLAIAKDLADGSLVTDEAAAPDLAGAIEIVAVHDPDAPAEVHRFLRRAVDHVLNARPAA